jgi:hypothetical protein
VRRRGGGERRTRVTRRWPSDAGPGCAAAAGGWAHAACR